MTYLVCLDGGNKTGNFFECLSKKIEAFKAIGKNDHGVRTKMFDIRTVSINGTA